MTRTGVGSYHVDRSHLIELAPNTGFSQIAMAPLSFWNTMPARPFRRVPPIATACEFDPGFPLDVKVQIAR